MNLLFVYPQSAPYCLYAPKGVPSLPPAPAANLVFVSSNSDSGSLVRFPKKPGYGYLQKNLQEGFCRCREQLGRIQLPIWRASHSRPSFIVFILLASFEPERGWFVIPVRGRGGWGPEAEVSPSSPCQAVPVPRQTRDSCIRAWSRCSGRPPPPPAGNEHCVFTLLIYTSVAFYMRGKGEKDGGGVENGLEPESYN